MVTKISATRIIKTNTSDKFSLLSCEEAKHVPQEPLQKEEILAAARLSIVNGVQESDLPFIIEAASIEENNYHIKAAVTYYNSIIALIITLANRGALSNHLRRTFIQAVEHRAELSSFFPNIKKIAEWISIAQKMAIELKEPRINASLEFLMAQNYWISHRVNEAVLHWEQGCRMAQDVKESKLQKRGLILKFYYNICRVSVLEAIKQYELSIGNIESFHYDFYLYLLSGLSMAYTQIGMPQRALGLCDTIRSRYTRDKDMPLLCLSFLMEGIILIEIRKLKESRNCLEKTLEISESEDILSFNFVAKICLICIECLENNYPAANKIFKTICNVPKSSWSYLLNYPELFEIFYMLYVRESTLTGGIFDNFFSQIDEENVYPSIRNMIHHLLIISNDKLSSEEKIRQLIDLDCIVNEYGSIFESAKIHMNIALQYCRVNDHITAKKYATDAWRFFRTVAKDAFNKDLLYLLDQSELSIDGSLSELVIEMGNALIKQYNIEGLLTNVIMSISRLTGAERTAIFIKDEDTNDLKMVASRNLLKEDVLSEEFQFNLKSIQKTVFSKKGRVLDSDIAGVYFNDQRKAMITPLMLKDRVIGCLYQDSRFFTLEVGPQGNKNVSALASQIALAIDQAKAHDEIAKLNKKLIQEKIYYINEKEEFRPFNDIIGSSRAIIEVQKLILKVAPTQSTVLIYGETGVGKELVARAIHRESSRKNYTFIRMNCAALPDGLIDSELFGHEKGAFTGAIKVREGLFELAHQGTIFLDEVSELPLSTQSRLLRILQEKEFQRVGGSKTLYSDFRLITATNKNLEKEIEKGRFREDLYYRLNVYPIRVPPLRERLEDIPLLADHFLKLFSKICNKKYVGFKTSEMEQLKSYIWPGNIRELSNIIERRVISGDSDLCIDELVNNNKRKAAYSSGETARDFGKNLNLRVLEKKAIIEALRQSKGKIGGNDGAAAILGLERTTLIYRMKKLAISKTNY